MARSRYRIFETQYPYFMTNTVVAWLPVFVHPCLAEIVFESWRFLQRERGVQLFGFVVIDQTYQLWQEGSHPQQIQRDEMMPQKLEYMHNNPIRRGYVHQASHWLYSSARNYEGGKGLIEVISDWR